MKDSKTTSEGYKPDNLLKYHTAISVVDRMEKEGFLSSADKKTIYTIIADKFGIDSEGIFAA